MPLCPHGAPTSGPSGIVTTDTVAHEPPVAPALLIRQDLAGSGLFPKGFAVQMDHMVALQCRLSMP